VLTSADRTSASAMIASSAIRHPEIVMLPDDRDTGPPAGENAGTDLLTY